MRYKVFHSYPLRPNVAVVILNSQNKILICERSPKDFYIDIINKPERLKVRNYWQFPQGGIDKNENLEFAAKREAKEETGLEKLELIKISSQVNTYYWNSAVRQFIRNRNHKNVGQKQNIVYFKFKGSDNQVKADQKEFINYKWIKSDELLKVIHPERLPLAKIVLADLKELAEKGII